MVVFAIPIMALASGAWAEAALVVAGVFVASAIFGDKPSQEIWTKVSESRPTVDKSGTNTTTKGIGFFDKRPRPGAPDDDGDDGDSWPPNAVNDLQPPRLRRP